MNTIRNKKLSRINNKYTDDKIKITKPKEPIHNYNIEDKYLGKKFNVLEVNNVKKTYTPLERAVMASDNVFKTQEGMSSAFNDRLKQKNMLMYKAMKDNGIGKSISKLNKMSYKPESVKEYEEQLLKQQTYNQNLEKQIREAQQQKNNSIFTINKFNSDLSLRGNLGYNQHKNTDYGELIDDANKYYNSEYGFDSDLFNYDIDKMNTTIEYEKLSEKATKLQTVFRKALLRMKMTPDKMKKNIDTFKEERDKKAVKSLDNFKTIFLNKLYQKKLNKQIEEATENAFNKMLDNILDDDILLKDIVTEGLKTISKEEKSALASNLGIDIADLAENDYSGEFEPSIKTLSGAKLGDDIGKTDLLLGALPTPISPSVDDVSELEAVESKTEEETLPTPEEPKIEETKIEEPKIEETKEPKEINTSTTVFKIDDLLKSKKKLTEAKKMTNREIINDFISNNWTDIRKKIFDKYSKDENVKWMDNIMDGNEYDEAKLITKKKQKIKEEILEHFGFDWKPKEAVLEHVETTIAK